MRNEILVNDVFAPIKRCKKCNLCDIQEPLLDTFHSASVMWVGLSAVRVDDVCSSKPLSSETRSGGLLKEIESRLPKISFYKTNLVKCLPESNGKIRYPTKKEMKVCSPHLYNEIGKVSPKIVLLLGKKVAEHVFKENRFDNLVLDKDFKYIENKKDNTIYVPVHHPSFILVYKRKQMESYINNICELISRNIPERSDFTRKHYYSKHEEIVFQQELSF